MSFRRSSREVTSWSADWYKELNELFPGQFFHIGEDETFELGEGQSREAAKAKGVGAVYFEHLNRVRDLLKPYNRRLMFWGDIALQPSGFDRQHSQRHDRDELAVRRARRLSDASIKPFKDAGLEQFVCPGAHTWNQIFPNIDAASKNITNFVRDGQKAGAIGMMNTTWDDDGESLFEMSWYPIALGAAAAWQEGALDINRFDRGFRLGLLSQRRRSICQSRTRARQRQRCCSAGRHGRVVLARSVYHAVSKCRRRNFAERVTQDASDWLRTPLSR